jgi:hypothetical protein
VEGVDLLFIFFSFFHLSLLFFSACFLFSAVLYIFLSLLVCFFQLSWVALGCPEYCAVVLYSSASLMSKLLVLCSYNPGEARHLRPPGVVFERVDSIGNSVL